VKRTLEKATSSKTAKAGPRNSKPAPIHPAEQYARDVIDGKIVACKWVKLACKRYFDDLKNGAKRGLVFDREAAEHRLDFYNYCKHSKGEWAGTVMKPEPWQQFVQWNVFGWKNKDGTRRFRTVYEEVARKNGKSTDLASTGLYLFGFDNEPGAEIYTAATKYDQACIIHSESMRMVKASPSLRGMINIFKNTLTIESQAQKYIPLGQDSNTSDGLNVHAALIDEYHAHPDAGMYDVLKTGMGARRQPLMYIITTAGFEKEYPCFEMKQRVERILDGSEKDDTLFGIIYTLDEKDDWADSKIWIKANPNLGVSKKLKNMEDDFKEALSMPSKQNNFKTKHLNIWTEAQTRWITAENWALNNHAVNEEGLAGRTCFGGLDLSSVHDLTSWTLCFPPEKSGDKFKFLYRFFIPQDGLHEKTVKERFDYETMVRDGFITTTPGNVIDFEYIQAAIMDDAKKFSIKEIAFDRWGSNDIVPKLNDELGGIFEDFGQGFKSMSPASMDFERKVMAGELASGNNPVMRWMIACTEIEQNAAGWIKPVKPDRLRTGKHIDGVITSIMALSRAIASVTGDEVSAYETEELLIL
jgi:phage terminase large subunit-like protein